MIKKHCDINYRTTKVLSTNIQMLRKIVKKKRIMKILNVPKLEKINTTMTPKNNKLDRKKDMNN